MYIIISKNKFSNEVSVTKERIFTIKSVYKNIPNQQFYTTIVINSITMRYTKDGIVWNDIDNEV